MESLIKLRPFQDEDIDLFIKWLYSPHVKQWYTEPLDWIDEIKKGTMILIGYIII